MMNLTTITTRERPRLLAGLLAGAAAPFIHRSAARAEGQPDIVVLLLNDARNGDQIALPQTMDLLAGGGTTFPNFFLSTPLCCPSRASIFTGLHPHNHGVYDNSNGSHGGWEGFAKRGNRGRTTGVLLQAAGYYTAAIGAYLNDSQPGEGKEPGWHIGPIAQRNKKRHRKSKGGRRKRLQDASVGGGAATGALVERASAIIAEAPNDQPLYLHIGFGAPHFPAIPAPLYAGQFSGATIDRNDASFDEEDVSDKPKYIRDQRRLNDGDERWLDDLHARRLETLLEVDDGVAAIWDALEARGRLDNTCILLMTDNGMLLGHHRFYGKIAPYDLSARMPLYAFGPGFAADAVETKLVGNVDIAPTLVEVAGANSPAMDGVSLFSSQERDAFLLELVSPTGRSMKWPGPRTDIPRYSALRTASHLYVEYRTGERELYDYGQDEHEALNLLAGTPSQDVQALAAQLAARLADLRHCHGASCV